MRSPLLPVTTWKSISTPEHADPGPPPAMWSADTTSPALSLVTVLANGFPVVRQYKDTWNAHTWFYIFITPLPHPVPFVPLQSIPKVLVNGFPISRLGDELDCFATVSIGSLTVLSG